MEVEVEVEIGTVNLPASISNDLPTGTSLNVEIVPIQELPSSNQPLTSGVISVTFQNLEGDEVNNTLSGSLEICLNNTSTAAIEVSVFFSLRLILTFLSEPMPRLFQYQNGGLDMPR